MTNTVRSLTFGIVGISLGVLGTRAAPWIRGQAERWTQAGEHCPHGLAISNCPFCTPTLIETKGQCTEHGVPEALCWKCNPMLVAAFKLNNDWCAGHACPESLCAICKGSAEPEHAHSHAPESAPNHDHEPAVSTAIPRSQRPPEAGCVRVQKPVQLVSSEAVSQAGLTVQEVRRQPVTDTLRCNAEVVYNANRFAQLTASAAGILREVRVDWGSAVRQGDTLALLDSPEWASLQSDYLGASADVALQDKNLQRLQELVARGAAMPPSLIETEGKLAAARLAVGRATQRLSSLGMSSAELTQLEQTRQITSLLAVKAPFDAVVVERFATIGEGIAVGKDLFHIADTSTVWVMLDVLDLVAEVQAGLPVRLHIDGLADQEFAGRVTWVSNQVDSRTRTLKVRGEFDNSAGLLKAHLFGRAEIEVRPPQPALVVPIGAVQWDGSCNVVFVKVDERTFQPEQVQLGRRYGNVFEVRSGLSEGQQVVDQGSFLLKTEIMKGEIGVGCCPTD